MKNASCIRSYGAAQCTIYTHTRERQLTATKEAEWEKRCQWTHNIVSVAKKQKYCRFLTARWFRWKAREKSKSSLLQWILNLNDFFRRSLGTSAAAACFSFMNHTSSRVCVGCTCMRESFTLFVTMQPDWMQCHSPFIPFVAVSFVKG